MDGNWTCGDHFVMYTCIKPLHRNTPEINIMLCQLHLNLKKSFKIMSVAA